MNQIFKIPKTLLVSIFAVWLFLMGGGAASSVVSASDIRIRHNGEYVDIEPAPVIWEGRTLVPARAITEMLGANVGWNPETRQVTISLENTNILLTIGSNIALVNGVQVVLDVPAQIVDGSTIVPLRFVAENLGVSVDFQGGTIVVTSAQTMQFGGHSWRVLDTDGDLLLLISEYIIYTRAYNQEHNTTWASSDIRHWLNSDFYMSFTASERNRIAETRVSNNNNPWFLTNGGEDTIDKIFLLSLDEALQYFGDSGQLQNRNHPNNGDLSFNDAFWNARIARNTDGENHMWWLRSAGGRPADVAFIDTDGSIHVAGVFSGRSSGGVRPVLWLYR